MTPEEFKNLRLYLGYSCRALALEFGIEGIWRDRTIRRWESGERGLPEWAIEKIRLLPRVK